MNLRQLTAHSDVFNSYPQADVLLPSGVSATDGVAMVC
jgi:hypothetical protein